MQAYFSDRQLAHKPQQYMVHGRIVNAFETDQRASILQDALRGAGLTMREPVKADMSHILAVHADHYLDFLRTAYDEFMALPNHGPEVLPNIFSYRGAGPDYAPRGKPRCTGIIGRTGWYVGDLSAIITQGTYDSSLAAADSALAAAQDILDGAQASMALCRPPGHHAYVDRASGFCFLNNAAIAAQRLRSVFDHVAILDFDTHHGDGTQAIFYQREDVFFGSTHTDPSAYYPHYAGYSDECGAGKGLHHNLNLPLPFGAGDAEFIVANAQLIVASQQAGAQALVISAGWDAHIRDPLSKLKVSTDAYARIGTMYGRVQLPTVIVQEGGYALDAIGEAASAFITAFCAARGL
ncbi:MAG: histone deacetylase family protein [Beijerinckiaceae bacterium]